MQQTRTYCDVCGKEIKKGYGPDKGSLKLVGRANVKKTNVTQIALDDLCYVCTAKLFSMINKFTEVKK